MKVIKEGHEYILDPFEKCPGFEDRNRLKFVELDEKGQYWDGNRTNYLNGKFSCSENKIVIELLEYALTWLNRRTANRAARGVEGKLEA